MALNFAAAIKFWLSETNSVMAAKAHKDQVGVAYCTCIF